MTIKKSNKIITMNTLTHVTIANINRDDVGNVKTAGDRIRVSSQCIKRHVRLMMNEILGDTKNTNRSRMIPNELCSRAVLDGKISSHADGINALKLLFTKNLKHIKGKDGEDDTAMLTSTVFMSSDEVELLYTAFCDILVELEKDPKFKLTKLSKQTKNMPTWLAIIKNAKERYGIMVSLFGRMFADSSDLNVEAAASFKHAFTVQAVDAELDFFNAVDDLNTHGSAHLGVSEFGSGTFYRCIHLDINQFLVNMNLDPSSDDDIQVILDLLKIFMKCAIIAFPLAKQHSNLAINLPFYTRLEVLTGMATTCDNAFVNPINSFNDDDIVNQLRLSETEKDRMHLGFSYNKVYSTEVYADTDVNLNDAIDMVLQHAV